MGDSSLPGVPKGRSSSKESFSTDLGMAVINDPMKGFAFLVPRTDSTAEPFMAPQGDAWLDPVTAAVARLTKTAATQAELKEFFVEDGGQPTQDAEIDDETAGNDDSEVSGSNEVGDDDSSSEGEESAEQSEGASSTKGASDEDEAMPTEVSREKLHPREWKLNTSD